MDPDCYGLDHGDSAVVCYRETDLVYSGGGVGVKNADPRLGGSFSELPHVGDDYTVRVRTSGAVEENCFSSEDYCRCPGELWYGRHVVFDIDDLVGPDDGPCTVPDCHRHIIRASTCKGVDGRIASPVPIICLLRVVQAENLNTDPRGFPSVEELIGCASQFPSDCSVLFECSPGIRSAILRSDQSLASGRAGSRCDRFSEDTSALRTLLLGAQDPRLCSPGFLDILGRMLQLPGRLSRSVRGSSWSEL